MLTGWMRFGISRAPDTPDTSDASVDASVLPWTVVLTNPLRPSRGVQGDTAVAREHRGHRLGLLLKIEMMAWLAETEPQLEHIETWNQADNGYMISVNEAIGYRLDRVFHMYELQLDNVAAQPERAQALAQV